CGDCSSTVSTTWALRFVGEACCFRVRTQLSVRHGGVLKRADPGKRVAADRARAPRVAAIAALPDLAVGEACEEAAMRRDERIRHRRERLGKPARKRLPTAVGTSVDARLWVATAVCGERAGARRDVPEFRVVGIDGDRPGVVAVAA